MRRVILASLWILAATWPAQAQVQSKDAQSCIDQLNQDAAAVALQQGKEALACLTTAGKGKLTGPAEQCLTADAKGKIAGKRQKTVDDAAAKCTTQPDFAYAGAAPANDAAVSGELGLVTDLLGVPLDATVIACAADADACRCQQQVTRSAQGLAAAQRGAFVKCTKNALQVRKEPFPAGASSAAEVAACVSDARIPASIAGGGKGALPRQGAKLADAIAKKCAARGVTATAFDDGLCAGKTGTELAACIESLVACHVCETVADMDALPLDCAALGCAAFHGSQTFTQTGVVHGFTVPAGVTRVMIRATGAQGGNGGGLGGVVTATIAVTPGEVLSGGTGGAVVIAPGCAGQDGGLGFGGNGAFWIGQVSLCANYGGGAGGGGGYGGGGAGAASEGGGGGGGSSYTAPGAIDVVYGPATGEAGEVVISW